MEKEQYTKMFEVIAEKGEKIGRMKMIQELLLWFEKNQMEDDSTFRKNFNKYRRTL